MKSVVLNSIVLGIWSHVSRLQFGKGRSTSIVLMNLDMHVYNIIVKNADSRVEVIDHINNGKHILGRLVESHKLSLHIGKSNLSLKLRFPKNGASKCKNDITSMTTNTEGILYILMTIQISKISISKTIHLKCHSGKNDQTIGLDTFDIMPNAFQTLFMQSETKCVTSTLMDGKGNIRPCLSKIPYFG